MTCVRSTVEFGSFWPLWIAIFSSFREVINVETHMKNNQFNRAICASEGCLIRSILNEILAWWAGEGISALSIMWHPTVYALNIIVPVGILVMCCAHIDAFNWRIATFNWIASLRRDVFWLRVNCCSCAIATKEWWVKPFSWGSVMCWAIILTL